MLVRTSKDIGALIRAERRKAHLSQAQLAQRVGATQRWLSQAENGKSTVEIGMVLRALTILGVQLDAHVSKSASKHRRPETTPDIDIDAIADRSRT